MAASAPEHLDYLGHLATESARFAAAISDTAPDARVPTCPDWNADDLLWHLGTVQWFWGSVVANGVTSSEDARRHGAGHRPVSRAGLVEFFTSASQRLSDVLAATPPGTRAWTWSHDHTVGFIRRRQAHEALIHRIDAELTAGSRTGMDPLLSTDGIDEALRIMYGGDLPAWASFAANQIRTLRVRAADTGDSWFVTLGQFEGTDPGDGRAYDEPAFQVAPADSGEAAAATVSANAADLDCWLWRRPAIGPLELSGSAAVLDGFKSVIAAGIS